MVIIVFLNNIKFYHLRSLVHGIIKNDINYTFSVLRL